MMFLYQIIVYFLYALVRVVSLFHTKTKLWWKGQQSIHKQLEIIQENDEVIWFHCASLGEFEQGRPLIEKIKQQFPHYKIVLTFFSPSGYEVRKTYSEATVVCYYPIDTKDSVKKFLTQVHPKWAFFVKYEFWPVMLTELKQQEIPTVLVSGIFRENQLFFKSYGKWMRQKLEAFLYFFVQNETSKKLLQGVGYENVEVVGDTRFDRVYEITQQEHKLSYIEEFVGNSTILVAGSTWNDDEKMLVKYINRLLNDTEKVIIAPHNIDVESCLRLKESIEKEVVLFSQKEAVDLSKCQVFIIDTIGLLTKIYSYADIAYVGGGYTSSGVHNILEPATYGMPVLIGPNYQKFNEAIELVAKGGCISVNGYEHFSKELEQLFKDKNVRQKTGVICSSYVKCQIGATKKILQHISL